MVANTHESKCGEIDVRLRATPRPLRRKWVERALANDTELRGIFDRYSGLQQWLTQLGSTKPLGLAACWPTGVETSAILEGFCNTVSELNRCHREAKRIDWLLRSVFRREWRDVLMGALAESPSIMALAKADSGVERWLVSLTENGKVPAVEEIVPPLQSGDLAELARWIDRHRKRLGRRHPHISLDDAPEDIMIGDMVAPEETQLDAERLIEAFRQLSDKEQAILRLHFDGLRIRDIAEIMGVSPSTVSQRLASAIVRISRYVKSRQSEASADR